MSEHEASSATSEQMIFCSYTERIEMCLINALVSYLEKCMQDKKGQKTIVF